MTHQRIVIPYTPRPPQVQIHGIATQFAVLLAHRRMGKTIGLVNHLLRAAFRCTKPRPQLAYVAPNAKQAKRIAWRYAMLYSAPIPGRRVNVSELTIDLPGERRIMLLGAERVHDLRGLYLDGCVLDEYAQIHPDAFTEVILPALLDRDGWAILSGTPLGDNQLKDAWDAAEDDPDWSRLMFKASETGMLSQRSLDIARRSMSEAKYAQEFECSFAGVLMGAYYGEAIGQAESQGRICDVPYDPSLGVTVAVDLGMADAFAAWFLQEAPAAGVVRAINYREWTGYSGYSEIKRDIDAMGYAVTRWLAPADIAVREQGTGKSRQEQARALGMPFQPCAKMTRQDGIEAVRVLLPRMVFDRTRCKHGLTALRQYRQDWDAVRKIGSKEPLHDWTSHGADALRTFATSRGPAGSAFDVSSAELADEVIAARIRRTAQRESRGALQ